MTDVPKRYTEREFSLILSKAAELAGSPDSGVDRSEGGLTLNEITSVAAEAGLEPDLIARAARLISDDGRPSVLHRVMGGTLRARREFDLPGELTKERAERILSAARRTMETSGVGDADASGVTWSTRQGHVFVSAHGEAATTHVKVSVNRRAALILPFLLGSFGVLATLSAAAAGGFGYPYLVLVVGAGMTVGGVWSAVRRIADRTQATLERLVDTIGDRERG